MGRGRRHARGAGAATLVRYARCARARARADDAKPRARTCAHLALFHPRGVAAPHPSPHPPAFNQVKSRWQTFARRAGDVLDAEGGGAADDATIERALAAMCAADAEQAAVTAAAALSPWSAGKKRKALAADADAFTDADASAADAVVAPAAAAADAPAVVAPDAPAALAPDDMPAALAEADDMPAALAEDATPAAQVTLSS